MVESGEMSENGVQMLGDEIKVDGEWGPRQTPRIGS